jgi:hypothetical protein
MINKIDDFGRNAGKIWETLSKHGSLSERNLMRRTKLTTDEFYSAIGWLARENKISKDGEIYYLDETNMNEIIGMNAGKVYNIISTCGEINAKYIQRLADIPKNDTYLALGWLAKEGKLKTKTVKPKKPQMVFDIK